MLSGNISSAMLTVKWYRSSPLRACACLLVASNFDDCVDKPEKIEIWTTKMIQKEFDNMLIALCSWSRRGKQVVVSNNGLPSIALTGGKKQMQKKSVIVFV